MTDQSAGAIENGFHRPRLLTRAIVTAARRMLAWEPEGSIQFDLPDGRPMRFGARGERPEARLRLANFAVIPKAMRRGSIGFAEAYIDGDVDSPDLVGLFRFFIRNRERLRAAGRGLFRVRIPDRIAHTLRANTRRRSRQNIAEHYDLGNAFYRLWLTDELFYSSGYFGSGAATLEDAQVAKADLLLSALSLEPGQRLLEIGCGWGELSIRAARERGARVRGITLSTEQLAHATARADAEGLSDACRFSLTDYRDLDGQFDRIVSVEMIEAVGEEHWPRYFQTLHDRLRPGGVAAVQAITIAESLFARYRHKADFIQRYIFPGGMLPTVSAMQREASRAGLRFSTVERFGPDYARTLREWRQRFEDVWPQIARLGFDERFRRKWRYYLAYCEAGFLEGAIDVGVYRLEKPAVSPSSAA